MRYRSVRKILLISIGFFVFTCGLFSLSELGAGFAAVFRGTTTVTAGLAPIRTDYPDGRILAVVTAHTTLSVHGTRGDRRGTWVDVSYKDGASSIDGVIDVRLTSFWTDFANGKVFQPKK
jgi:hypothetical protein